MAKRNGFFRLPPPSHHLPVTFFQTLGAFLTYLIFALLILPIILVVLALLTTGEISSIKKLPSLWTAWLQVGSLWMIFLLLILYCFLINPRSRHFIFWGEGERSFRRFLKGLGMGVVAWVVSYPFVLFVSLIAKYISVWIWGETKVEQVAVKHLKMTMGDPYLFSSMVFAVVILVPYLEELLFRGFFHNLMKRYLGRNWAIGLTAVVFSLAHFSFSQGIGNFQLILSLFVLALFLSFIYEREGTLWAPMGLHVAFNGLNVMMIIFSKAPL